MVKLELLYDTVLAEEELEYRTRTAPLTADHLKALMLKSGISEKEAESARASFQLRTMQNNGSNNKR